MKIIVKAKTKAKVTKVEKLDDLNYKVSVKEAPTDGKANQAIVKALALYFDVSNSSITLLVGQTSKQKVFMIK
jgi:uncharacterized protein